MTAKAPPDGYTLLLSTSSQAISATLYRKLNYDLMKDFAAVSFIASGPQILVLHPSLPAKSLKELVGLARARPGDLMFGTGGVGTAPHLAGEMFKAAAQTPERPGHGAREEHTGVLRRVHTTRR